MTIDIDFLPNYGLGGFDATRLITFYEENFDTPLNYDYHVFGLQLKQLEQQGVIRKLKGKRLYILTEKDT